MINLKIFSEGNSNKYSYSGNKLQISVFNAGTAMKFYLNPKS
jgi:hypothetical protein